MHVLIVPSEHLVTDKSPLSGIFQYEQAQALSQAGTKVGVISVGFVTLRYVFSRYKYNKIECINKVVMLRNYKRIFIPHRYISQNKLINKYISLFMCSFDKYVKLYGMPDIIHAHNILYAGFIALEIKTKYKIPYVITEHSSLFARNLVSHDLDSKILKVCQGSSTSTCVSSNFKEILEQRFKCDFKVLHNIVDKIFFEKELTLINTKNNFVFINVATLDDNKNQKLIVMSFYNKFKNTNAVLKLIGEGIFEDKLKKLVFELGLKDQVFFLGQLSRYEVRDQMLSSHCFVLSSNFETFGVVLIEALASGLPVISTKCGGPEDIVNDNNGLLVEVGDQKELGWAMQEVFYNYSAYNSNCLRQEALTKYSDSAFVKNVTEIYENSLKYES